MRCLVTGGCGFIGTHLTNRLLELGHHVLVLDDLSGGGMIPVHADFLRHNICDPLPVLGEFDRIFHLAAQSRIVPSLTDPTYTVSANVQGTLHVLELARKQDCPVVYAGSSSFYSDPKLNPYALTKWFGEELCQMYTSLYNIPTGIARFFNVFGPGQPENGDHATVLGIFHRQRRAGEPLTVVGDGQQRRDFIHVFDIVEGLIALAERPANIYNLGTGTNHAILDIAQAFEPKEIKFLPHRPWEAQQTLADITATVADLGWQPKHDVLDFIKTLKD